MRVSESWLSEWVNPEMDTQQLAHVLTMAGLEVDDIIPAGEKFSGVVIAKVLEVAPHPDAKKLNVCDVDNGSGKISKVICGASNVRKGLMVAFAEVGAVLPNDFKIEAKELRGIESFGMICSASELGLAEDSKGIMELPNNSELGADLYESFSLDDQIIDIDLTPNRSDCLSIRGVAREVSALLGKSLKIDVSVPEVEPTTSKTFPVDVHSVQECPRYVGRVIDGISGNAQSPIWMQEKLRRAGIRAINAITDITNFVMLELGQPMHAFDLDKLNSGIEVRTAKKNETLLLLDGQTVELTGDELIIADAKQAIALAGIMGGQSSSIQDSTTAIFLESAYFKAEMLAGKARRYGLHTESSHRFERGVDPKLAKQAIERATELIIELVGGKAGPIICEEDQTAIPTTSIIQLAHKKVESLLGISITVSEIQSLLQRLQCEVDILNDVLHVSPPSYRFDLKMDVDLIEEVARMIGYENIPADVKALSIHTSTGIQEDQLASMKEQLVSDGYHEVVSFSFIDQDTDSLFNDQCNSKILANPISNDLSVMRSSIWPGLLKIAQYNLHRQQSRIRIFEQALQFKNTDQGLQQLPCLAGLIIGDCEQEQWSLVSRKVDFYDLKGDVENLLAVSALPLDEISFLPANDVALHPGQSANIVYAEKVIGRLGKLHPQVQSVLNIDPSVYLFELQLNELITSVATRLFQPISKYPFNRRDITLIVDERVNAAEIRSNIEQMNIACLKNIEVVSVYKGEGVPDLKKSISLGLILQEFSRTLTDKELEQTVSLIISQLEKTVGAEIKS